MGGLMASGCGGGDMGGLRASGRGLGATEVCAGDEFAGGGLAAGMSVATPVLDPESRSAGVVALASEGAGASGSVAVMDEPLSLLSEKAFIHEKAASTQLVMHVRCMRTERAVSADSYHIQRRVSFESELRLQRNHDDSWSTAFAGEQGSAHCYPLA